MKIGKNLLKDLPLKFTAQTLPNPANLGAGAQIRVDLYNKNLNRLIQSNGRHLTSSVRYLVPTGNDDSALVEEFVNDMAASGEIAGLDGEFIIAQPMTWYSHRVTDNGSGKWGNKGIGLNVQGKGAGNTVLKVTGNSPITIQAATDKNIGARNYLTKVSGLSALRYVGSSPIAAGATDGSLFMCVPAQAGDCFHTPKFSDLFLDGFDYPLTLSDCTLPELDTVWFHEFKDAIRLGYNIDLLKIRHGMFGSEQFGTTYRNDSRAIVNGYSDGFHSTSNSDNVVIDTCWFMKHGVAVSAAKDIQLELRNSYFEGMRQYFDSSTCTEPCVVSFDSNHFSLSSDNDDVNYPKSVFGVHDLTLNVSKNTGTAYSPLGGYFGFNSPNTTVDWRSNRLLASGSGTSAHLRWLVAGSLHQRTLPNYGKGTYCFGGTTGMSKLCGPEIPLSVASTGTISTAHTDGDLINIPALTGNLTINPSSSNPTQPYDGTVMTYKITSDAVTGSTYNVTWSSSFIFGTPWVNATATGQTCVVKFERRSGKWVQIGYGNKWF